MPASAAKSKSATRYDVHPGVAMVQKWIVELKPKRAGLSKNGLRW